MHLTGLDRALWLIGGLGQIVLLGILLGKRRFRRFPWFTAFIAYEALQNLALLIVYRTASSAGYFWTYWGLGLVDCFLQLGLVYEMAREVLRPAGVWVRPARATFIRLGFAGAAVAALLSFAVNPTIESGLYAWPMRANIFTSLVICESVVAIFLASHQLGLHWRDWVMGMARGLGVWMCCGLLVEIAHGYWGWSRNYSALDHLRTASYDIAMVMLAVSFWHTEPERKPMAPELRKALETWHQKFE